VLHKPISINLYSKHIYFRDFGTKETVDCITLGDNSSLVYAACGDNNVHVVDLEHGKQKMTFSGHTDFIHSLSQV